jgi:hypothetical protein
MPRPSVGLYQQLIVASSVVRNAGTWSEFLVILVALMGPSGLRGA